MFRGRNAPKLDSEKFNELFVPWWEKECPGDKDKVAEEHFRKLLIENGGKKITSHTTIHSWRFGDNKAIGRSNLDALEKILGVSVELTPERKSEQIKKIEKSDENDFDSQLALHFYTQLKHLVDEIYFNPNEYIDEIMERGIEITNDLDAYLPFLSAEMGNLLKIAVVEILGPLTQMYTYAAEYAPEIGYFTEDYFHVTNFELLVKTHEDIMAPFKKKLEELAENIKLLLKE